MGQLHILAFIVAAIIVVYVINKRLKQKEKEKHLTNDDNNQL